MSKQKKPLLSEEFLNEIAFEMAQVYGNPDHEQSDNQDKANNNGMDGTKT